LTPATPRSLARSRAARSAPWSIAVSLGLHLAALGSVAWWTLGSGRGRARVVATVTIESAGELEPPLPEARAELERSLETPAAPSEPRLVELDLPPPAPEEPPAVAPIEVVVDDPSAFARRIDVAWTLPAPEPVEAAAPEPAAAPLIAASPPPEPVVVAPALLERREPDYPRLSRRLGEEGVVVLRVRVASDGSVAATVERSSGFERLDRAAVAAIETWSFAPATRDGVAIPWEFDHEVTFELAKGG
jgi:protein TonB